jgi:nonsense-mediated mRNA decay protein 3
MICVECGKELELIKNGLCLNCYVKSNKFTKGSEYLNIKKCTNCCSYRYKNKWETQQLNELINQIIIQNFKISEELKKPEFQIKIIEDNNQYQKKLEINITGFISNLKISEKHLIQVNIKKEICDICSKKFGGYHEAIIQIRADKRKLTSEEINSIYTFVQDYIKFLQNKGNKNIFISDYEIIDSGINFFLSDNSIALSIINKIQDLYAGEIKKSSKNIGMKEGKQIYRMTYLLRLYPFKKGDILSFKDKYYLVKKILKNKISIIELENWNEIILNIKELAKFIIKGGNELIKKMILINQTNNELQIMDQNNYNIFIIKKPKKILFNSDMIKTIQIQDKIFLYPIS